VSPAAARRAGVSRVAVMKLVNLATLVAVLALNGLAATGAMSGDSIGMLANRYESLFLPANYVFGIWSLIYLGLAASVVYQLLPTAGAARAVERIGPWWVVASVLNVALISNTFQFAHAVGWGGFGIAEPVWAVAMMIVVTLLGVAMAWALRAWVFPLVVAWALRGIGERHAGLPAIATAVDWLVPVGIVAGALAYVGAHAYARARARSQAAAGPGRATAA
jgi:hypothetical protein